MADIRPFRGLRPPKEIVSELACLPYDVMNSEEAAQMAKGKEKSLLRITRAEIELPGIEDIHSDEVYGRALKNFNTFQEKGWLLQDDEPKYTLNANLVNFDMPSMGFSMDSSCTIKYELVRNSDGKQVFQEAIKQGYHAPFAEALIGAERARLASSKAVRENVTHTLRVLSNLDAATLKGK